MRPKVLQHDVTGEGEPLLLYPGGLTGWLSWIPHAGIFSRSHRVVRVQPIHNEMGSAGVPGDPTYTAAIERESLALTLDELGIRTADMIGWSSGGRALLEFAMGNRGRVRRMVLIEPAAHWILDELGGEAADDLAFVHSLAGQGVTEQDLADFLVVAGLSPGTDESPGHPMWDTWLEHRMALSWQMEALDHPGRTVAELSAVEHPTLLVKGSGGAPNHRRIVDVLGDRLPNGRVIELNGDHSAHLQDSDRFVDAVEGFLTVS